MCSPKCEKQIMDICRNNYLVSSIKCDKPCSDGFEVENLISQDFLQKSKGFMVERFINPPVTITFEFKCEIEIRYLVINCKVGAQKSSGLEIYSSTNRSSSLYESLGSGVLQDINNGFVFHTYNENVKSKYGDQYYFCTFRSSHHLSMVKHLKIKIFRTCGRSVPAIGKIEIWGIPCKSPVRLPMRNVISGSRIYNKVSQIKKNEQALSLHHSEIKPKTHLRTLYPCKTQQTTESNKYESITVSVPDDFIDAITYEVMSQPVILPSGKVIDISTLESHQKAELQWGRGPNDPFTGIPFNSFSKPIAATDLKARIDKFLTNNSNNDELKKVPRTVGRSFSSTCGQNSCKASVSKLINRTDSSLIQGSGKSAFDFQNERTSNKRRIADNDSLSSAYNYCNNGASSSIKRITHSSTNSEKCSSGESNNLVKCRPKLFQEAMEDSLELALKSTLAKLPKLTADKPNGLEKPPVVCNMCKRWDNMFSIPCSHFICRSCLVTSKQQDQIVCSLCKFPFKSSNVQRVHLG